MLRGSYDWFLRTIRLYGHENEILTPSDAVFVRALMKKVISDNRSYSSKEKLFVPDEVLFRWVLEKYGIEPSKYINDNNDSSEGIRMILEEVKKKRLEQEEIFPSDRTQK